MTSKADKILRWVVVLAVPVFMLVGASEVAVAKACHWKLSPAPSFTDYTPGVYAP